MRSPTVSEVLSLLSPRIPFDRASDWDVSGLHLGDASHSVGRLGVCHELNDEAIDRLAKGRVDAVVVYHPLVFRPTRTITAGPGPGGRAFRLIREGISVIVAHTAFDMAAGGTADALASALELEEARPFGPAEASPQVKVVTFAPADSVEALVDAMASAGGGTIGNYSACHFRVEGVGGFDAGPGSSPTVGGHGRNREAESRIEMVAPAGARDGVLAALVDAHPYEEPAYDVYPVRSNEGFIGRIGTRPGSLVELVDLVGTKLGGQGLRVAGDGTAAVGAVAVVPGSGGSFVAAAAREGAKVLVTGDVSHHSMIEALDRGMAVVDAGHAATERPGMAALVSTVAGAVGDAVEVVDLTGIDPTPWR